MKIKILVILTVFTLNLSAQNLFPVVLSNCKSERFCLDCGDIKAGYNEEEFEKLLVKLQEELNLQGLEGSIKIQVLIDSNGRACVLSHNDKLKNKITLKIIKELNKFKNWTPSITNGKKEEKTSINLVFKIKNNKISARIERVDLTAFKKSFDKASSPEIYNKTFTYNNENLSKYKITVWNSRNSNLPNNMNDHITIDQNGIIWLTIDEGLLTFDGNEFKHAEQNITAKGNYFNYYALECDNNNLKWIYAKNNIYSYNDSKWTIYDSSEIGINGAYEIVNNPTSGEVFFCSDEGLTIYKNGKWTNINKNTFKELPSNRVCFAKRDSKNRIWIGTFSGTAMIDENNQMINFEKTSTILKGKCVTSMDEDELGNLYFCLFEFNPKDKQKINDNEGFAIRYTDGTFKQFTTNNSGMPFNHTTCILYDRIEKVLWISTDRAGLVRYDLKDGWENYHNENSEIPTSYISKMIFDKEGNLYLATRQGLVKIEKK